MNILLINGSPRGENGNTIRLSNAFCEGIIERTNANIESINLNKLDIKDCKGCFVCWKDTPGVCCIKDDMQEMLEKIKSAGFRTITIMLVCNTMDFKSVESITDISVTNDSEILVVIPK